MPNQNLAQNFQQAQTQLQQVLTQFQTLNTSVQLHTYAVPATTQTAPGPAERTHLNISSTALEEDSHLAIPASEITSNTVYCADLVWQNGTPAQHAHLRVANPIIRKQQPRRTRWVEVTAIGFIWTLTGSVSYFR